MRVIQCGIRVIAVVYVRPERRCENMMGKGTTSSFRLGRERRPRDMMQLTDRIPGLRATAVWNSTIPLLKESVYKPLSRKHASLLSSSWRMCTHRVCSTPKPRNNCTGIFTSWLFPSSLRVLSARGQRTAQTDTRRQKRA